MQLIDSLDLGGSERVALNLANLMPRKRYQSHLCTTRRDGPLADAVRADVGQLCLHRRHLLDLAAIRRLTAYLRQHEIRILHAHGTAIFVAAWAATRAPFPKIVWHDHFGNYLAETRPAWLYRLLARRVAFVFTVNRPLVEWSRNKLRLPADRVAYLPNFPPPAEADQGPVDLPGAAGKRIVCVANFRPQKDHLTLLAAMCGLVKHVPDAHLLLVGAAADADCFARVRRTIGQYGLEDNVSVLGERRDVAAILRACDVGVLSSRSEGLPLALLEYGTARLPVVVTRVGQCPDVLEDGRLGLLVPPEDPDALAAALRELLDDPARRATLAERFHRRVSETYSAQAVMEQVCQVYDSIL